MAGRLCLRDVTRLRRFIVLTRSGGWPGPAALVVVDRSLLVACEAHLPGGATVAAKLCMRSRLAIACSCRRAPAPSASPAAIRARIFWCSMRRLAQAPRLGQRVPAEQAQLVDEPAVHLQQLGVAGELDQGVVEAQVREVVALAVVADRRVLHPLDHGAQLGELLGADRLRQLSARPSGRGWRAARRSRRPRRPRSRARTRRGSSRCRTRPVSARARSASRTGPRETPSRSARASSFSFSPVASSPARTIRSSSRCTSMVSEWFCRIAMFGGALLTGR